MAKVQDRDGNVQGVGFLRETPDDGSGIRRWNHVDRNGFIDLMHRVARAWADLDEEAAVACFSPDAIYMQPPDVQFYAGTEQLRAYFAALEERTFLEYQNLWFDETPQIGCAEFSFGVEGQPQADHGTIVVHLEGGLIGHWREYVQKGPANFEEFLAVDKDWRWHIGNYP